MTYVVITSTNIPEAVVPNVRIGQLPDAAAKTRSYARGEGEIFEGGLPRGDAFGDVPTQLRQHGGVGIGGRDGDAVAREHARGLAGARADLEGRANRATRIREHLAHQLVGVPRRNLS
jgi:hypothetical protein